MRNGLSRYTPPHHRTPPEGQKALWPRLQALGLHRSRGLL